MKLEIRKVAVLGAGTMGARIAAHLANAGLPCFLLDMAPAEILPAEAKHGLTLESPEVRNRLARGGLDAAMKARPTAFFTPETSRLITIGNFDDNLAWCRQADWIIEAVAENLEIKQKLLARVEAHRRPGAIVTTNTSGLSVARIAERQSTEFQQHWAGAHFFNPPRYLKLVELIRGPLTKPEVATALEEFCDRRLGKGVVSAKDTPNFIANRIGTFSFLTALRRMAELGMSIEEADACTGPAIGRPKSATFRTADIVGLDVLASVVRNLHENAASDESREMFRLPEAVVKITERGWLGEKSGRGFYQRVKKEGDAEILALNLNSLEYHPVQKARFGSIETGRAIGDTRERLRALVTPAMRGGGDKASQFLWGCISDTCLYAARRIPEIADNIVDVDHAMRWGFGWELGPFEVWDALGVEAMAKALERDGSALPSLVTTLLGSGAGAFYEPGSGASEGTTQYFDLASGSRKALPEPPGIIVLKSLHERDRVVELNSGASLVDLGDGVVCCEFHTKMNVIGEDIAAMIHAGLRLLAENFEAMVIANQATNFSVGANLMLLLLTAQDEEWDEIEMAVRRFQELNMAIKRSPRPVVVAPQGLALGGGCEIMLHAPRVHAAAEAYIGLVETGVGLIPAGGGTKEMLIRANERAATKNDLDLSHALAAVFETMAMAKVSTSAEEARELGFLRAADAVSMNRDRLVADAKETALAMVRAGYHAPAPAPVRVLGEPLIALAKLALHQKLRGGYISEFDALVARKLASVLAGGSLSAPQFVSEEYVLDLEREAFVSLCGERKTQERIAHTLQTGKPLRN
jgi:3-hydroxyacyl-CoA dehydrogenase